MQESNPGVSLADLVEMCEKISAVVARAKDAKNVAEVLLADGQRHLKMARKALMERLDWLGHLDARV